MKYSELPLASLNCQIKMLSEVSVLWWTGVEFNLLAQKLAMLIVGYFLLKGIEKQNAQE